MRAVQVVEFDQRHIAIRVRGDDGAGKLFRRRNATRGDLVIGDAASVIAEDWQFRRETLRMRRRGQRDDARKDQKAAYHVRPNGECSHAFLRIWRPNRNQVCVMTCRV
jgi:hypothetical protein